MNPKEKVNINNLIVIKQKAILPNRIIIYENHKQKKKLIKIVQANSLVWKDCNGFVIAPADEELQIELYKNWEQKFQLGKAKVYTVDRKDQALINKTFDKLHKQDQLKWISKPISFSFPMFCV